MISLILCLSLLAVPTPETSQNGTQALASRILDGYNDGCTMTDLAIELINDRAAVCSQGQSSFFNGERRSVNSGVGIYPLDGDHVQNAYELSSCGCAQNGVWTRTFARQDTLTGSKIRWNWKYYARKADCTLELKRDLTEFGCWSVFDSEECGECPEGSAPYISEITRDCECIMLSPVVIDLDGGGVRMSSRENGVEFDFDGDGHPGRIPWTREGWLVLNDRLDFIVRDGTQFFGDQSPQPDGVTEPNGYTALRLFDDNSDNLIDSRDGIWPLLAVWQDANRNGVSDFGEARTLDAVGLTSISLNHKESRRRDRHGNEFRYRSRVEVNGRRRWSWDVFFGG